MTEMCGIAKGPLRAPQAAGSVGHMRKAVASGAAWWPGGLYYAQCGASVAVANGQSGG